MNYINEIKDFYNSVAENPLSTGQIALWHALIYINNKCYWKENFSVPNITLQLYTGLSLQGLIKARNALKQRDLIDFSAGKKGQAPVYKLKTTLNSVTNSVNNSITEVELSVQQKDSNGRTLIKQKTKDNNISPIIPFDGATSSAAHINQNIKKINFADNVLMSNAEHETLVKKYGEEKTRLYIDKLSNYKASTGKKYKSDYRAILSWVIGAVDKDIQVKPQDYNVFDDNYSHEDLEKLTRR